MIASNSSLTTETMPLRRYIFNTLTVVSLVLLLGVVGLWADGKLNEYSSFDQIRSRLAHS